jgi:hypothetical protein
MGLRAMRGPAILVFRDGHTETITSGFTGYRQSKRASQR